MTHRFNDFWVDVGGQDTIWDEGQEARLAARVREGEELVQMIAAQVRREGLDYEHDDLVACGRQGLVEAALRFDESRDCSFRHFAYYRVRGAMFDGLRKMGNWSRRGYERIQMLRAANTVGASVATVKGSSPEQACDRLHHHMAQMVTAMTVGVFAESAVVDGEWVAKDRGQNSEELVGEVQLREQVRSAIDELPEPDREIIQRHYLQGERLDKIAREFGYHKSWATRVHTRALQRLQRRLKDLDSSA
ncbi:MAG: sigma-70 family RNA polymerase sigma factor [Polyangiaceae bacterium]|nr:sigma-70 family RNA polymerase sigma factor [Polyangiaceae bacterium]